MNEYTLVNGLGTQTIKGVCSGIERLERETWPVRLRASYEMIFNRLELFSDGLWRMFHNGVLVSYMYFIRIDESKEYYSWFDYSAGGTCNNFVSKGKLLFGITIGAREKGMGNLLFSMGMDLISNGYYKGVHTVKMCSRIPSLKEKFGSVDRVPKLALDSYALMGDHVVKMFMGKGCKPVQLCYEGYAIDEDSLGYSLTMEKRVNAG